jgi:hypothetical protein
MKSKLIRLTFFSCFCTSALSASQSDDIYTLSSNGNKIIYAGKVGDAWRRLSFLPEGAREFLLYIPASPNSIMFEESTQQDFSRDKNYLMLNMIEHATVSSEPGIEMSIEKYFCSFVDMRSGCVVQESAGEFCGGTWGAVDGEWIAGDSSSLIDRRQDPSFSRKDYENYFRTFADHNNLKRCLPH